VSLHRYEPPSRVYQLASVALVHAAIAARDKHGLSVVGIDIAGQEAGFPAAEHQRTFELAHKNWLGKTVHAGEAWGPESVFQAITGGSLCMCICM
jgi:adenosine deaminase